MSVKRPSVPKSNVKQLFTTTTTKTTICILPKCIMVFSISWNKIYCLLFYIFFLLVMVQYVMDFAMWTKEKSLILMESHPSWLWILKHWDIFMGRWGVSRDGYTCEWPLGSLVWARNGGRGKLPNILHYNTNFLSMSNRRFQVNHKTLPPLVMFIRLDIWQLQRTTPRTTSPTWLRESDLRYVRSRWA